MTVPTTVEHFLSSDHYLSLRRALKHLGFGEAAPEPAELFRCMIRNDTQHWSIPWNPLSGGVAVAGMTDWGLAACPNATWIGPGVNFRKGHSSDIWASLSLPRFAALRCLRLGRSATFRLSRISRPPRLLRPRRRPIALLPLSPLRLSLRRRLLRRLERCPRAFLRRPRRPLVRSSKRPPSFQCGL